MRGAPDYRKPVYPTDPEDFWGRQQYVGNAEAVARLGSADVFDRRGTTFLIDDFDAAPLRWRSSFNTPGGGVGHSVTRDTTHPYRGEGCMRIAPPDAVGDYSRAYRYIGGVAQHRLSMEINIMFEDSLNIYPQILMRCFTGTRQVMGGIRIRQQGAGGLMYLNNLGANPALAASWTTFDDTFSLNLYTNYPLKFVVDVDNERYLRCIFGGTEIDMSQYTPYAANSAFCQRVQPEAWVINGTTSNPEVYLDDFIFKIQEPYP